MQYFRGVRVGSSYPFLSKKLCLSIIEIDNIFPKAFRIIQGIPKPNMYSSIYEVVFS